MAISEITFDPRHAVESMLFILGELGGKATLHHVLKVQYLADKLHLSEYGSLASGDRYCAMPYGPVASSTYYLLRAARGEREPYIDPVFHDVADGAVEFTDRFTLHAIRAPRREYLSASEIECLSKAAKLVPSDFRARTEQSHGPAWKLAQKRGDGLGAPSMDLLDIVDELDNAAEVRAHLTSQ